MSDFYSILNDFNLQKPHVYYMFTNCYQCCPAKMNHYISIEKIDHR